MKVREGLGQLLHKGSNTSKGNPLPSYRVGKVYGVILNENNPSKEIFEAYGGWGALGMVFYKDYNGAQETELEDQPDLTSFSRAYPIFPNQKIFPVKGELILIFNLPSEQSQINPFSNKNYYISIISLWNSTQNNAQAATSTSELGKTFFERPEVRPLQPYEGDIIYEGRDGNGLRLGGTSKDFSKPNNWSSTGDDNDPIVILGNGYNFPSEITTYIEDINKDKSSIYLTSTQTIPLKVDMPSNPIAAPLDVDKYNSGGQILASADRIVISSKTDATLIHGKTSVGLYSPSRVTIDSKTSFIVNSPKISLGINGTEAATEPVLLGNKTVDLLTNLISSLISFSSQLAIAISTPKGTSLTGVNQPSIILMEQLTDLLRNLENLKSNTTFTK